MRVGRLHGDLSPVHIKMALLHKSNRKGQSDINEIHFNFSGFLGVLTYSLGDCELPVCQSEPLHPLGVQTDSVVDVDGLFLGVEPHLGGIGLLEGGVLDHHSQRANPGDLLSSGVLYEEGVHLEEAVGDEVEGEVLFSVDREAEELAGREHETVVRVSSHTQRRNSWGFRGRRSGWRSWSRRCCNCTEGGLLCTVLYLEQVRLTHVVVNDSDHCQHSVWINWRCWPRGCQHDIERLVSLNQCIVDYLNSVDKSVTVASINCQGICVQAVNWPEIIIYSGAYVVGLSIFDRESKCVCCVVCTPPTDQGWLHLMNH